jgi:hypothetical protein
MAEDDIDMQPQYEGQRAQKQSTKAENAVNRKNANLEEAHATKEAF